MDLPKPLPVKELAKETGCKLVGNSQLMVRGLNEIHKVREGDLTFVDVEKYYSKSLNSAASIILINKEVEPPEGKALLICDEPFEVYNSLVDKYCPFTPLKTTIHPAADIHPTAILEPHVVVGPKTTIGAGAYVRANTFVGSNCTIGKNVIIGPNSCIGGDAFYFKKTDEGYRKWTTGGRVIIEDDVEIGCNCTLDKGVSGDTIIGRGSKLDNLIHIGHGVVMGKNCLIAGQSGVSGKTILGDNVTIMGQVGIAQNLKIGDNATILAKSGVSKDVPEGAVYFGYPAGETREKYRELAAVKMLARRNKKG